MSSYLYNAGDYQTMTVPEKIDFLHKVHKEEISLWDDDGNDNDIWNDYHIVRDELLDHPEMFSFEDILHVMKIFDDDCFEITMQFNLAKMMVRSIVYHGKRGIAFYLQNLQTVPKNGRFHGWHFPIQWLMEEDTFSILKEALQEQNMEIQKVVLQILDGIEVYQTEKDELREMINEDFIF